MAEHPENPLFLRTVDWLLAVEGGDADDPADGGGRTRYGISQRSYPDLDIGSLTRTQAIHIYHRDYWQGFGCDALPPAMAVCLFDGAVQHRPSVARTLLQEALGVRPDGVIGPVTLRAAQRMDGRTLVPDYLSRRAVLYRDLSLMPAQYRFFRGWLRRLFLLQAYLEREVL